MLISVTARRPSRPILTSRSLAGSTRPGFSAARPDGSDLPRATAPLERVEVGRGDPVGHSGDRIPAFWRSSTIFLATSPATSRTSAGLNVWLAADHTRVSEGTA